MRTRVAGSKSFISSPLGEHIILKIDMKRNEHWTWFAQRLREFVIELLTSYVLPALI